MFTAVEMDYVAGLVEQMRGQGYLYYIARTVTDSGSRFDLECVFSKDEIMANGMTSFSVPADSVLYQIDSTGYTIGGSYNQQSGSRVVVRSYSGSYSFADTEFGYSNATFEGGTVLPDLRRREGQTSESNQAVVLLLGLSVLLFVFALWFRR